MSANLILNADWQKYEDLKKESSHNPEIFHPENTWENEYLIHLILQHYPQYTDMAIRLSIERVKRRLYGGCKRRIFVELVLENLMQRKPFIAIQDEMDH